MRMFLYVSVLMMLATVTVPLWGGELEDTLQQVLQKTAPDETVPVLVKMSQQLDVEALKAEMDAARIYSRRDRHQIVVEAAQSLAQQTQPQILDQLNRLQQTGQVTAYHAFWISNMIYVQAKPSAIQELAQRADVGIIYMNRRAELRTGSPGNVINKRKPVGSLRDLRDGLVVINAPQVWEMGYTGQNRLVCTFDGGCDGNHEAFTDRWRGNRPEVQWWEAWRDPYGDSQFPYEAANTVSHGTHVMGILTGNPPDADPIGVAYEAEWIAAGVQLGQQYNANLIIDCYEWAADPDGDPTTIDDVPDVINNSWGTSEDCADTFWEAIDVVEAAGIVNIIAVDNAGPSPGSVNSPESRAETPTKNFAVGNVNPHNPELPIASNSGRGPSPCDGTSIKPEVTAPGQQIYSCLTGNRYGTKSGASMAAPHVSGVVALLRQVNPDLTPDQIKEILMTTAYDRGDAGEDNTYGWGVIDAQAAVNYVLAYFASIHGQVVDSETTEGIPQAQIEVAGSNQLEFADNEGYYSLSLPAGNWTLTATAYGYHPSDTVAFQLDAAEIVEFDFLLTPMGEGGLQGQVTNRDAMPIRDVRLQFPGTPLPDVFTDSLGMFEVDGIQEGLITVDFFHPFYQSQQVQTEIEAGAVTELNVTLNDLPQVLIWEPDGDPGSGAEIQAALAANGISSTHLQDEDLLYYPDLNYFRAIFVCLGMYDDNFVIANNSPIGLALANYIEAGGMVYLEGGDCWYWDPGHGGYDFNSLFGISSNSDGSGTDEIRTQIGSNGEFAEGFRFEYNGAFEWVDHLQPTGSGFGVIYNENPFFYTMVGNQTFQYRTVGASLEFGGLIDSGENTKAALMDSIITFLLLEDLTDVETPDTQLLTPKSYVLYPNYPNPFNPKTTIRFDLPHADNLSLNIYDLNGKLVQRLITNQPYPAGSHTVEWDAAGVPSGVYLYQLETPKFKSKIQRAVVLK